MNRRDKTKKRFPDVKPSVIDKLFDADPSGGAYGTWMTNHVGLGNSPREVMAAIKTFHEVKQRLPHDRRDLYTYGTLKDLKAASEIGPSTRKKKQENPGYTLLREFENVSFYLVNTFEGMRRLGRNTQWCVTQKAHYPSYRSRLIVVAINHLRGPRHPYSKVVILSRDVEVLPVDFRQWKHLRKLEARPSRRRVKRWEFWNATDAEEGVFKKKTHLAIVELLDNLAGRPGATVEVLEELYDPRISMLVQKMRGCRVVADLVKLAEYFSNNGLNPLSLLDHPMAKSQATCQAIWDTSTMDHQRRLCSSDLDVLGPKPAINVPELLEMYLCGTKPWLTVRPRGCRTVDTLLYNRKLTKASKQRVLEWVQQRLKLES